MDIVSNWTILRQLNQQFLSTVHIVCIFGENEVLFVTHDDDVYAFGDNNNGCLGLGHNNSVEEPTKVDILCNKSVTEFAYGDSHVLALTKNGVLYSCGYNEVGQLGNGTITNSNEPQLIDSLIGRKIKQVSCGKYHSVALTHCGNVFAWGYNNCGQIGNQFSLEENQLCPVKVRNFGRSDKVEAISCGGYHSLALTQNGFVYSWGRNDFGQLGCANNVKQIVPIKINVTGVIIAKICSGQYHSLLLSTDGDVYSFGLQYPNDQISEDIEFDDIDESDVKTQMGSNVAKKVVISTKFTDIAASNQSNISVALSQTNGYCYIWGESVEEVLTGPKETPIKSMDDIFAIYSLQKITYKPIVIVNEKQCENKIVNTISKLFNDSTYSDLKFTFDKDANQIIYCHKLILKSRCEHFRSMLSENWSETDTKEIELEQYSYSVYYSFLKYVYTDCVDISPEQAMDLYDLANCYLEEDLKQKCSAIIKSGITVENFCKMYSDSIKYSLKEFEDFCFDFALNHLNSICTSDGYQQMDSNLCKRLTIRVAKLNAFK